MKILHIDCSPRPESFSRALSAGIVDRMLDSQPSATVVRRDLGRFPIPHAEEEYARILSSPEALIHGQDSEALELSEQIIAELERADIVVIGTPMNNFTVPSVLKAWIDQVLRFERTFTAAGQGKKIGLLKDRPVYIAVASGGFFAGDRANQPDFLRPYLTAALGCIGLHTLHFLPLQGTAFLASDAMAQAFDELLATFDSLAAAA
ncbi:FMN-dependent NADH-azoreductase [Luteibacter aegosomatissinici]|uniref:FMN-dependent NADH-azoreductase n=1 Tax=Luteibacter aegosomatissinici TaxID=2911539 RepID=UPI001FFA79DF|nr:NAD(P)H-dependent oxidoreductase [Luteibacter aegosomatissinici]UPG95773.1 NAD(P)H-dependent oxidoreductase [Luteibacter aegosomatissinici]